MADIDFSHAVLDVYGSAKPMTIVYLGLTDYNLHLCDGTDANIYSFPSVSIIQETSAKVSILFAGTMSNANSLTRFIIKTPSNNVLFEVSNISFSSGDTYSFIIDIETSGNV